MSPRAACRLETLGFVEVYDYVAGKVDWLALGLPTDGTIFDHAPEVCSPVRRAVSRHFASEIQERSREGSSPE